MIFQPPYSLLGSDNLSLHLHRDHLADLRASGLTDETIRGAGVYSIAPRLIQCFFNARKGVPSEIETALCFPYPPLNEFARIKLFPSLDKMKYSQPPKTSARLYIPFPISPGLVYVVEGEKKTLAACQIGLNAVGIGGVWSWLTAGAPIDDLGRVNWDSRDVVIIPDSDVFLRFDLMRAIYALGRELRERGASIQVAQIPQDENKKVGLDDFLLDGGEVSSLASFTLDQRVFSNARFWHSRWKLKAAMAAAVPDRRLRGHPQREHARAQRIPKQDRPLSTTEISGCQCNKWTQI